MTQRWRICLVSALVLLLYGCATTENHKTATQAPVPPPPPQAAAAPPPAVQPATPPPPDPVDVLVKQVDALYASGIADYQAGDLQKSKQEFDQALSTLLQSKLDVQGDERLSSEFNKLVEDIYTAEATSLEHGDALSLHNYEPTPLDSLSGLTFPVDPRTKQRVQQELKSVHSDLPLVSNDAVDGVIAYLQNHARGYVETVLRRLGTYGGIISEALRKEGVPQDLIYLAAAESAFNPYAVSNQQCVGIWQFSAAAGVQYGLRRDSWVDERKDPAKSSAAAARYLKELYQSFGDWYLAMAAYDTGPMNVQHAIERTGYADFWELRRAHALLSETENYVPIFLATALIAKDPKAYGFNIGPDPALTVDSVIVDSPTDLRLVAQLVDHPADELVKLNPSLQRWTTPANDRAFVLYLPPGTKDLYTQTIASIPPDKRLWWRAHRVQEGETLDSIAKQLRVSPIALAQANQLTPEAVVAEGTHLVIPMASGSDASTVRVREPVREAVQQTVQHRLVQYRVQPGDTVDLIADRYNVTAYQIRRWNGLKSSKVTVGRTLHLYVEAAAPAAHPTHPAAAPAHPSHSTHPAATASKPTHPAAHTATTKKPITPHTTTPPAAAPATALKTQ